MERQLSTRLRYRDVFDVEAYAARVVREVLPSGAPRADFDQLLGDALLFVVLVEGELEPGASLQAKLGKALGNHLRDCYRKWRTDYRRNTRAGITTVATPTGMAVEHGQADQLHDWRESARATSRDALAHVGKSDLRDPRWVGRYVGVPSHMPLATGAARDLFEEIEDERLEHDLAPYVKPHTPDLP